MAEARQSSERRDRFFDGRTATAHDARLELEADTLLIKSLAGELLARWPLGELAVVDENQVNGGLTLTRADGGTARLLLFEGLGKSALLQARPDLLRWRWRHRRRTLAQTAIWVAATILVAGLLYLSWRDLSVAIAGQVPRSWEAKVGSSLLRSALIDKKTCSDSPGQAALDAFLAKIKPPTLADVPVTIDVIQSRQVNAFALPGGHIILFSALIRRAASADELAGVLAHELSHIELRHPLRGIVQQIGTGALLNLMFGGGNLGTVGQLAAILAYSREMEAEADARAVALLRGAGFRANGLANFLSAMARSEPSDMPDWLSTHPEPAARATALPVDAGGASAFDDDAWQAVRSICGGKQPDPAAQQERSGSGSASGTSGN